MVSERLTIFLFTSLLSFHVWTNQRMPDSFTIQLNKLRFSSMHGVFAEEAIIGNEFEVNLSLLFSAPDKKVTALDETINYAEVYRITKDLFSVRRKLLETLAMEIAEALKTAFPSIREQTVQIQKLNPPIASFTGTVSVTYKKSY